MEKVDYKKIVDEQIELIVVLNSDNDVIFKANKSPLSSFLKKIYTEDFKEKSLSIYANQIGIGLAELGKILDIRYYYGTNISIPAKNILDETKIKFEFKEIIELVKSSSNPEKICPVENKLNTLKTFEERIKFLQEKAHEKHKSCSIDLNKK